jgi:hypothetical protein
MWMASDSRCYWRNELKRKFALPKWQGDVTFKLIGKIAQVFGLDEITRLLGESLSMQTGNLSSKRKN